MNFVRLILGRRKVKAFRISGHSCSRYEDSGKKIVMRQCLVKASPRTVYGCCLVSLNVGVVRQ
jgi:hypothetical protein